MTFEIHSLGVIDYAKFELGDLTIICGKNNTGKTYITHSVYGLMDYLRNNAVFPVDRSKIDEFIDTGVAEFSVNGKDIEGIIRASCMNYSKILYNVLAGEEKHFKGATIDVKLNPNVDVVNCFEGMSRRKVGDKKWLRAFYSKASQKIRLSLDDENNQTKGVSERRELVGNYDLIRDFISSAFRATFMSSLFPHVFISSVERTGAAIFQKELDFTASGMLELIRNSGSIKRMPPALFLRGFSGRYPLAVRRNINFIRDLSALSNRESFLVKQIPKLLSDFSDIIGGNYIATKDGDVRYLPSGGDRHNKLALVESSSAVRSLLDIGFYLRHIAMPGDLLMVDEPELNLHPENQRRIAQLFAKLVNHGIKIFMTTHSDYIVKEFNTLMMLKQPDERLRNLARKEKYEADSLLDAHRVKVYIAEEGLVKKPNASRRTRIPTLLAAQVTQSEGAFVPSFDSTIDEMNRIQDEILWGKA